MSIEDRCRELIRTNPSLGLPEHHYELWVEYNARFEGLPRALADELLSLRDRIRLANYESVRRASRRVIHEEGGG